MTRRTIVGIGLAAASIATAAAACTTFDDASLPEPGVDASVDAAPPPHDVAPDAVKEAGPPAYLSTGEAARLCSKAFACSQLAPSVLTSIAVPIDPANYSACVDWLSAPLPTNRNGIAVQSQIFHCMALGTTCAEALACIPIENVDPSDPRCAGPEAGVEHCADDAGTVVRCKSQYVLHCSSAYYATGSKCMKGADGTHWCSIGSNCTTQTSCIGTLLDYCGSGSNLHESVNCAAAGYRCDTDPEAGTPDCLSDTAIRHCSNPGPDCLDAAVAVCDGYQQSIYDCTALGAACDKKSGPARCARTSDKCSPYDSTTNACNGTSISLCVGGAPTTFDCASIGLTCKPAVGAQSAHCG